MNTRCYRCGWSFSLSREAIEAAVAQAAATGEKSHVEHCPRCRQAIKISVDQLKRALPPGWTPPKVETPISEAETAPATEAAAPREAEASSPEPDASKTQTRRASKAAKTRSSRKSAAKKT